MNTCLYCAKTFSNKGGLSTHQPFCKSNPDRVQRTKSPNAHRRKGTTPWNKGITLSQDHKKKISEAVRGKRTGKASTPEKELERVAKIKQKAILNNGGYRQGSGRGKKGWYKGFFCDSSWELAYVVYCLDHHIDIKRNTSKRQYVWKGKVKNYIPDFEVEGVVTEIKGYKTEQWLAKLEANPDVKVLYQKELESIFAYVTTTYGRNFIDLYEQGGTTV